MFTLHDRNLLAIHFVHTDPAPSSEIVDDTWISLTAKINFKFHKAYMRRGPVLTYISHEPCEAPNPEVATFY